jgi:hypothetical protein
MMRLFEFIIKFYMQINQIKKCKVKKIEKKQLCMRLAIQFIIAK